MESAFGDNLPLDSTSSSCRWIGSDPVKPLYRQPIGALPSGRRGHSVICGTRIAITAKQVGASSHTTVTNCDNLQLPVAGGGDGGGGGGFFFELSPQLNRVAKRSNQKKRLRSLLWCKLSIVSNECAALGARDAQLDARHSIQSLASNYLTALGGSVPADWRKAKTPSLLLIYLAIWRLSCRQIAELNHNCS